MKRMYIPREVLGAEIRSGRVSTGKSGIGGAVGGAAAGLAASGLQKAAKGVGDKTLQFPGSCCNCLTEGTSVRPVESVSIVNRGVPYTFRFTIPHCASCRDTANRKRLGVMGLFAIFFASSVLIGIAFAIAGAMLERGGLTSASFVAGPLAGLAVAIAAAKARRPRPGQASAHQAVYVSGMDVEFSGTPKGAVLAFANDAYADRFLVANGALGVKAK
jgi:hypothetical protein